MGAVVKAGSVSGRVRGVAILGSTGSIGTTALRVLERQRGRFRVAALTAYDNARLLGEQADRFAPNFVGIVGKNGVAPHPCTTWYFGTCETPSMYSQPPRVLHVLRGRVFELRRDSPGLRPSGY